MECPNCHHWNEGGGNFCEQCGAPLPEAVHQSGSTAAADETRSEEASRVQPYVHPQQARQPQVDPPASFQNHVYVQNARKVSRQYFSYFASVIKRPFAEAEQIRGEQFINGLITMLLFSLLIPFMLYFNLGEYRRYLDSPFLNVVIKPVIIYAVFLILLTLYSFGAIRLSKVQAGFKDVLARFGAMLVPFVGLFAVAFILSILQLQLFVWFLMIGLIGSLFIVPILVVISWVKGSRGGLDLIYCALLILLAEAITLRIFSETLYSSIARSIFGGSLL
ncbi:zinc ribbon domain-containing protein [Paenibacillus sp. JX-17]|uniref:Zinc ribbon domain-containing protein n=1 Tax=Paenibacillus lacisoli TaxID=3064525 RepID=A0ABT9CF58_9BACL|nr:zinc ribbon domain-containing protein [Paenibacillus sp. JX-17]MDO7906326.1 zinc ribbon domain-containing protein [Paenibacillus sp. JX-17]